MDRTDGYVQEIEYTHRYCGEMAPGLLDLACVSRGISCLPSDHPPRYLEMAFGQGVSINLHAAACPGEFWGFDFNPAHLVNARELAAASRSGAMLFGDSFENFAAREGVPQFDVIAMHGTWSWISAENRHRVVEIVRRRLAPGGLFYLSYNCWPGWATEMPLRHLLMQHAESSGSREGLAARIDASMDFAQSFIDAGAEYFEAHPRLEGWLRNMRGRSRSYLAHEYFNRDWHPMHFSEVAQALSGAGLTFAASATISENFDAPGLSEAGRQLLAGIQDPMLRETARDYLVNRRFRRDIFIKEPRTLQPAERDHRIRTCAFTLLQDPGRITRPDICRPLIKALAEQSYSPKTLGQLAEHPACAAIPFDQLAQTALLLTSAGSLHPVQSKDAIEKAGPHCTALNARLLERAAQGDDIVALVSPVTGAGVPIAPEEMLFLHAIGQGRAAEDDWAKHAWELLKASDPVALRANARAFARIRLPVLKALQVA